MDIHQCTGFFIAASNNVPDSRCSEEHLIMRTGEIVLLKVVTYIWNIVKQPMFRSDFDEGGHNCPNGLH